MREIIVVEKTTVTENGRTILHERKVRGLLYDNGEVRLLSYCGRRIAAPQPERRSHAKTA